MNEITDKAIDLNSDLIKNINEIPEIALSSQSFDDKINAIENVFLLLKIKQPIPILKEVVNEVLNRKGDINSKEIYTKHNVSERTLERYFKSHIGVSPKFYSRIIRFSHIFNLVSENHKNWSEISYRGGYYDQSHFIKEFKEFTGEEPSIYGFELHNLANFFLNPKKE